MKSNLGESDFLHPTEDTLFDLCMGKLKILYGSFQTDNTSFDHESLKDLLIKHDLKSYISHFVTYQKTWFNRQKSMNMVIALYNDFYDKKIPHKIKVAKILKLILSSKASKKSNLEITFAGLIDKIQIEDPNLTDQISNIIIKEFENLELNETPLDREEALKEILEYEDIEWLFEYSDFGFFDGYRVYPDLITEEHLDYYIETHYKPREITLDLVNNVINELEGGYKIKRGVVGAKIKNLNIGELARRLSYIHRIDLFLNQDEYSSIKKFPLANDTCRFIYDYFELWGLLYDHVKFPKTEGEKRANYIKSLIRNNEKIVNNGTIEMVKGYAIVDLNLDLMIDLFRMARKGEISISDYNDRISSLTDKS